MDHPVEFYFVTDLSIESSFQHNNHMCASQEIVVDESEASTFEHQDVLIPQNCSKPTVVLDNKEQNAHDMARNDLLAPRLMPSSKQVYAPVSPRRSNLRKTSAKKKKTTRIKKDKKIKTIPDFSFTSMNGALRFVR